MNWAQNLLDKYRMLQGWARERLHFAWRHRTATIGSLGIAAGGVQNWLAAHKDLILPPHWHGILLSGLGALVAAVGIYNSVTEWLRQGGAE